MKLLDQPRRAGNRRHGQALTEFAIALPFLIFMTVGTFAIGVNVDRQLTVTQLVRNAGNMYARGIDFSVEGNKELLLKAAGGLQMTTTGGKGVIYLSTIIVPSTGENADIAVVAHRIVIGNSSLRTSDTGTPGAIESDGDVTDYVNAVSARATVPSGIEMVAGDRLFVAEVFHTPEDLLFPGLFNPEGLYSRAAF